MTPKTQVSRMFRDAVLNLAGKHAFARPLVNSGRLSQPCAYDGFALFGEDALGGPTVSRPGTACPDGPVEDGYLLDHLGGGFTLLAIGGDAPEAVSAGGVTAQPVHIAAPSAEVAARYLGEATQAVYLIRPDQHVVARWSGFDAAAVASALGTAIGKAT